MENGNLTNDELRSKAVAISFTVFSFSEMMTNELQKNIEELNTLSKEEIERVFYIVSYVILIQAQKLIWERYIENEDNATIFEKYLYQMYGKTIDVNPILNIQDYFDYVQDREPSREIQYIGHKITNVLNKKCALLELEIVSLYTSLLIGGFYQSMDKAWKLPKEQAEKLDPFIEI